MKRADCNVLIDFACMKYEGNIGMAEEHKENYVLLVEAVGEITYLGDGLSAGGGCEAARTRGG